MFVQRLAALSLLLSALSIPCVAAIERGIIIREAIIYVAPDPSSAKLSNVGRGREVAVIERAPGWANVVATVETDPDQETERNVTGWVVDKGIVTLATPDGDKPPAYFYKTFIRPDPKRPYAKVWFIAMDMRQLRYFVRIVESGSLAKASRQLSGRLSIR